ncbi:MAG TPA: hypothetical protein VF053_09465 [Streptosporangiales bacterium]
MSTTEYVGVARPATMLEVAMRQRGIEGPGHAIAFVDAKQQGTTVPAFSQPIQTSLEDNPAAAAKGGDASGLRLWRHPV